MMLFPICPIISALIVILIYYLVIIYHIYYIRFEIGLIDKYDGKHWQMGSRMKKSIFDEQTSKALKKWHMAVKKKQGVRLGKSTVRTMDTDGSSTIGSVVHSSGPTLHRFKTIAHSTRPSTYEDQDEYQSDIELSPTSPLTNLIVNVDHGEQQAEENQRAEETNN